MDMITLLVIVLLILLLGGGWYGRGRWYGRRGLWTTIPLPCIASNIIIPYS